MLGEKTASLLLDIVRVLKVFSGFLLSCLHLAFQALEVKRMEIKASDWEGARFIRGGPGELSGTLEEEPLFPLASLAHSLVPGSRAGHGATLPSASPPVASGSSCLLSSPRNSWPVSG